MLTYHRWGEQSSKGTEMSRTPIKESRMDMVVHRFGQTNEVSSISLRLSPPGSAGRNRMVSLNRHLPIPRAGENSGFSLPRALLACLLKRINRRDQPPMSAPFRNSRFSQKGNLRFVSAVENATWSTRNPTHGPKWRSIHRHILQ